MANRPLRGYSIEELKAALKLAQEDLLEGKTLVSTSAGDASAGMQLVAGATPEARISKILNELSYLDSINYPPTQYRRRTRTVASFS
jgi:hypothetical protein